MHTAANTNRILTGGSSLAEFADSEIFVNGTELLRHIVARRLVQTVHSEKLFEELTSELIWYAEQSLFMRDLDALDNVSLMLMNLPVSAARQIGSYYRALAINRKGHQDEAKDLLIHVVDNAPITWRSRAVQTLGAIHHRNGQIEEALRLQLEACRMASDKTARGLQTRMLALWEMSISRALAGDHNGALSDLYKLRPIVNLTSKQKPFYFFAYCNALAVELGELGRHDEARAAIKIALASPYAPAYPEWAETRQEIEAKRTAATAWVVAVHRPCEQERANQAAPQQKPKSRCLILGRAINDCFLQRPKLQDPSRTTALLETVTVLDRVLICIGPRGPPLFPEESCRLNPESNRESAEGRTGLEEAQTVVHWFWPKSCCSIVSRGIGVPGHSPNELSRGPPLGRDIESEADWLTRLTSFTSVRCFKGNPPQQIHKRVLRHAKVSPHKKPVRIQGIKVGHRVSCLPTFSHGSFRKAQIQQARVKEPQE